MIANQARNIFVSLADFPHIAHDAFVREAFAMSPARCQTTPRTASSGRMLWPLLGMPILVR